MLYLGIDQYARQLTVSLRDEAGDVLQARQMSTRPETDAVARDDSKVSTCIAVSETPLQKFWFDQNL